MVATTIDIYLELGLSHNSEIGLATLQLDFLGDNQNKNIWESSGIPWSLFDCLMTCISL